jgi:hypothetical protein
MDFRGIRLNRRCISALRLADLGPLCESRDGRWRAASNPLAPGTNDSDMMLLNCLGAIKLMNARATITGVGRVAIRRDTAMYFADLTARGAIRSMATA